MDSKHEKQYIFNMKLAKIMGLYQILTPDSISIFGYNIYHIVIVFFGAFMFVISMLFPIGLLYLRNDMIALMYYMGCISNFILSSYKMGNILYYSKDIWRCIDVTNFYFISYKHYDRNLFKNWQTRSIRITYIYIVIALFAFFCWIFSPCVMNKSIITIRNIDGSYTSHETYNMHFYIFYIIEIIVSVCYVYFTIIFDVLMLLICFAISYQLETISSTIKSLGYNLSIQDSIGAYLCGTSNSIQLKEKCDIIYNDLITIITDHQHVIKKLNDFYNMFRLVTLIQIFIASSSHVFIWSIGAMSIDEGDNADSILSFKLFIVLPLINFQLFMTCSLFGTINEKKDSIIFALYSSNWTDMDLKSKTIILFGLTMNNANQLKMKFTNTKIVNLEMFSHVSIKIRTNTMRFCYSIFSMLVVFANIKNNIIMDSNTLTFLRLTGLYQILDPNTAKMYGCNIYHIRQMKHHKTVIRKLKEYYTIFRPVTIIQIFIASSSHIIIWFVVAMATKKDSIIFALYSSNWTEMDIKCKKLILLAMEMNNANHLKMKFTSTKIVNKEMFTQP
ncbi:odorant receptor 46a-like, partial [Aphis craccivora]